MTEMRIEINAFSNKNTLLRRLNIQNVKIDGHKKQFIR